MSSRVVICPICIGEARPIFEDLQSISACGHVFHELCLQRWIDFCRTGLVPTCPLCKAKISCGTPGVHRLYFESASPQVSSSQNLQRAVEDPKHVNCSASCKLESKPHASMKSSTIVKCVSDQFKELESQVTVNLERAKKAEAAAVVARSDLASYRQHMTSVQEELKHEQEKVQKVRAIVKDLTS